MITGKLIGVFERNSGTEPEQKQMFQIFEKNLVKKDEKAVDIRKQKC